MTTSGASLTKAYGVAIQRYHKDTGSTLIDSLILRVDVSLAYNTKCREI